MAFAQRSGRTPPHPWSIYPWRALATGCSDGWPGTLRALPARQPARPPACLLVSPKEREKARPARESNWELDHRLPRHPASLDALDQATTGAPLRLSRRDAGKYEQACLSPPCHPASECLRVPARSGGGPLGPSPLDGVPTRPQKWRLVDESPRPTTHSSPPVFPPWPCLAPIATPWPSSFFVVRGF